MGAVAAFLNFAIAVIVVYQIAARNVLVTTSDWVFQIATYLNAWAALLGISFALIMDTHIAVSALPGLLRRVRGANMVMRIIRLLVFLLIGIALVETSAGFLQQEQELNVLPPAGVAIPLWLVHLAVPISGVLIVIAVLSLSMDLVHQALQRRGST
jgi:TRAP-type C4-dicarboxylate transport system permease small subunit